MAGTDFASAIAVHDHEASRYWSNAWWGDQSPQYDDFGQWYRPGYWKWVPEATGWYSVDSLNSRFADGTWLSHTFYIQVLDADGGSLEGNWDQVGIEVTEGTTYYVIITCRYTNDARYSARLSAVAEWSDWITSPPTTFTDVAVLSQNWWRMGYAVDRTFGGPIPGLDAAAFECSWRWGRKLAFTSQPWDGTCATTAVVGGMDAVAGPNMAVSVLSTPESLDGHQSVGAAVTWSSWSLDPDDIPAESNYGLVDVPGDATAVEFEGGETLAEVSGLSAVVTTTDPDQPASMAPIYPAWTDAPTSWGPYLDTDGGNRMAGGPGGPESVGIWTEPDTGTEFTIDPAAMQAAHDVGLGYDADPSPGWMLLALPTEALSDDLPAGVEVGVDTSYTKYGVGDIRLDVTYQPARFRYVVVEPPDLTPPLSNPPPCQLYPRDDDQGVGTGAIWPAPSSGQPGGYY